MSKDDDEYDLFKDAKRARDEAVDSISEHHRNWMIEAAIRVRKLDRGWKGTGEDIRLKLVGDGLEPPHHHNAWGALLLNCVRKEWLVATGEFAHMRTTRSHARMTPVYVRA